MIIYSTNPEIWRNTDPRDYCSYGYYRIIIVRPGLSPGQIMTGEGDIDTKHQYYIHTSFEDHRSIDKWDFSWWWILAPQR